MTPRLPNTTIDKEDENRWRAATGGQGVSTTINPYPSARRRSLETPGSLQESRRKPLASGEEVPLSSLCLKGVTFRGFDVSSDDSRQPGQARVLHLPSGAGDELHGDENQIADRLLSDLAATAKAFFRRRYGD
jgi:hypothetical protein